jgi:hypothetical protein
MFDKDGNFVVMRLEEVRHAPLPTHCFSLSVSGEAGYYVLYREWC